MSEENKALVRRIGEEAWNQGSLTAVEEIFDYNYVTHGTPSGSIPGVEKMKQAVNRFRIAFPDLDYSYHEVIADGDKVMTRVIWRGTHKGEFAGIPPTGKQVTVTEFNIYRIANGKIVESWLNVDSLSLMRQLGVVPE